MTFRRDVDLDPGRLRDTRGRRVRGGGLALGGGIGTLLIIAVVVLLGGNLPDLGGPTAGGGLDDGPVGSQAIQECETGEDANRRQDCRLLGTIQSLDAYWSEAFAGGTGFEQPGVEVFRDAVDTACGGATSAVGPFYCPLDRSIYVDLIFYEQLEELGAAGGPLSEMYVAAHEYGHHIQNLLGLLDAGRDAGAEGGAVRTELQADCFAGVWAANAVDTGFLEPLTRAQVDEALDTAAAIGDDHIQRQTQGRINQDTWTHGSSEQRRDWFLRGLDEGVPDACDTTDVEL